MKILLVEADVLLSASLTKLLKANRYTVDLANNGQIGLDLATAVKYDLILLDVQVPKLDGIHLCRQLRLQNYRKPILLLTANSSDADAIAGFDAGADDCISKPCAPNVLLARIRTLLRRSGASIPQTAAKDSNATLTWGDLCLNLDSGHVTFREQVITLTAIEYNLLELFLRNPNLLQGRWKEGLQVAGFFHPPAFANLIPLPHAVHPETLWVEKQADKRSSIQSILHTKFYENNRSNLPLPIARSGVWSLATAMPSLYLSTSPSGANGYDY